MVDVQAVQIAFLLCEAIICFIAAGCMRLNSSVTLEKKRFVTYLNLSGGVLLLSDYLAYIYRGQAGTINYVMVRLANFLVFFFSDFILYELIMYICVSFFGDYGLKTKTPCDKRVKNAYALSIVGMIMVIISQFTNFYYYFDENNMYHRGPIYVISALIPVIILVIIFTVVLQYRANVEKSELFCILFFIIAPAIAVFIQTFSYGISFINMAIGFSFIIFFGEASVNQSRELLKASKTEAKTGLINEIGMEEQIDSMSGAPVMLEYACVFFDLANFGRLNQKYDMPTGNQIIREMADRVSRLLTNKEALARHGGDKFIALVKKTNVEAFEKKLTDGIDISFEFEGEQKVERVVAKGGIYYIDNMKIKGQDAISNAYLALLYAKNLSSKNFEVISTEMRTEIEEKKALVEMIPQAMQYEEFLVYYQPKVNSRGPVLCGAEALVRWLHDGKLIPPGKFIPVLERKEFMCDFDFYMLEHVCKDIAQWIEKGMVPPTISVNFSRKNLSNKNLASDINDVVTKYHVPKKMIEIEITETIDEFPLKVLKDFVDELHKYGFRVAVDDFGCGSSSLSLLREVTFDTLKIDKGFVDRAYAKDLTILSYIIKLAKAINLEILAEGVEEAEQVETLSTLGCDIIQGYYYDRPLPKDVFENRLENRGYYNESNGQN